MSTSDAPDSAPRRKQAGMHDNKIMVGRFEVDTGRPLSDFEHTYAEAFEATSSDTALNDHVAIVIKGRYPARRDVIDVCMNAEVTGVMVLRVAQPAYWPADDAHRYVLIYKRPAGNALFQKHVRQREPLAEDTMRYAIIRPIFHALRMLADRRLFHGSIRPDNIFLTNPENPEALLGDFVSSVPGINQPVIFETIERAMADVNAKGAGQSSDDIYALGVTVALLLHGKNPLEGQASQAIIEDKMNRGSYAVLTDGLRMSPGYSELLRATLNDDPAQRWTVENLSSWVDGSRTTPKQSSPVVKAQRAIDFNGKKYIRAKALAYDLSRNPSEAVALIESGNLGKWLERALGDPVVTNAFNTAVNRFDSASRSAGYEEKLICLVCMALDPQAPIRFRDLCVFPNGIGYALALATLEDKPVQNIAELLRDRYAWMWLNQKDHANNLPLQEQIQLVDQVSKMVVRRGLNQGLERCLYELCPDSPCLSEFFVHHYVVNSASLLLALDDVAQANKEKRPMDRHIASFITMHDVNNKSSLIVLLEGADTIRRSLGLITMFQQMQKRDEIGKLEHLATWLVKDAEIVAGRFKSIKQKNDVLKQIPKEARSGNLTNLLMLIDGVTQVKRDEREFNEAVRRHVLYGREQERIRHDLTSNPDFGLDAGRNVAFMVSIALATLMVLFTFASNFMTGGN